MSTPITDDPQVTALQQIEAAGVSSNGMCFLVGWFSSRAPELVPEALESLRRTEARLTIPKPYYFNE